MPEGSSGSSSSSSSSLSHPITACTTQLLLLSVGMYEDLKEYLNWYDTRRDTKFAADAPVIGLVLQRSHLVTGDEGHYSGVVSELEAQGAKVMPHAVSPSALLVLWLQKAQGVNSCLGCPPSCFFNLVHAALSTASHLRTFQLYMLFCTDGLDSHSKAICF